MGAGPAEVTAAAASIKWLTRDGLGAMGRLVVGVRGGVQIDEDPRLWRMVAEAVATLGLALEVLSQFRPGAVAWFLALAGGGTFLRAMGKGLGRPSFRVIQTHFAAGCNVGDVAAKEEIWEVTGQLTGLGLSVALLSTLEDVKSPATVMGVWGLVQGIHVALRLQSLRQLQMGTINYKRAVILIRDFLAGKEVPSVADCCARESIASWDGVSQPQARIGCTLEEALAACALSTTPRDVPSALLREHCAVGAGYVAMVAEGRGWVFLERSSGQVDRLRGLFHALHLLEMGRQPRLAARTGTASDGAGGGSASSTGEGDRQVPASWSSGEAACEAVVAVDKERGAERRVRGAEEGAMAEYAETERDFAEFMRAAEAKGWRIDEDHVTLLSGDDRWSMRDPPGSGVAGEARPGMAVGSLSE